MTGMKDQYFGVEVEMTGITREQAAQALADYFGTVPLHRGGVYDAWIVKDTENKEWKLMSDSSIRGERKTPGGYEQTGNRHYWVEMVTPKLSYAELPKFQECVRQVRHAGAKVNSSCGLHIHVDAANHNRQSLKNLLRDVYKRQGIGKGELKTGEKLPTVRQLASDAGVNTMTAVSYTHLDVYKRQLLDPVPEYAPQ